jgi:HAD superfamily hydrolase (TIGR01549 family)
MFPGLRAIFFDVDFTLIYPGPVFQGEGYREFCAKHGIANCDPSAFHEAVASASALLDGSDDHAYDVQVFVRYIRHIIERMGGSGDRLDACALEIYREWAACHHFSLYDDVLPALRSVRTRGLRIGLISNTHRSLDAFQSHFDLEDLIGAAVSSQEHGFNKPHPSIFRTALRLLGVAPGEALMVGDSFGHDVMGARAVGMNAVWLRRRGGLDLAAPAARTEGVPVISSLAELPALLAAAAPSGR